MSSVGSFFSYVNDARSHEHEVHCLSCFGNVASEYLVQVRPFVDTVTTELLIGCFCTIDGESRECLARCFPEYPVQFCPFCWYSS